MIFVTAYLIGIIVVLGIWSYIVYKTVGDKEVQRDD